MVIYSSSRGFVVFSYECSHGRLVLRSGKERYSEKEKVNRITITFVDVVAMECRMWFDGLSLGEEPLSFLEKQESKPMHIKDPEHRVYSIICKDWKGFIVAGNVFIHEDQCAFFEGSNFETGESNYPEERF